MSRIFYAGQSGEPVLQRLREVAFTLEDEVKGIGIFDVTSRVSKAFDVEKITRRFYERFRTELTSFGSFIEGITSQGDREWYASLMLNRMMFVYFVQKRGFLDGDSDYLRNRLHKVQAQSGGGHFQQFYRLFLLRLFHEGLGQPEARRTPELAALLGKVPFLNGGLFDVHDLEHRNPRIDIPDEAFKRVFDFFDDYLWHLDERRYREDNEINPDVLGHIFEKYVNQKQMGAYYTKEDVTGYISRNTVIPFLFDAASKESPAAFGPDGGVWRLLREDPDRYIYPAVGHGLAWNAREVQNPIRLSAQLDLPEEVSAGIDDASKRGAWSARAPGDYGLPTETWREVVARRQRYMEVRDTVAAGDVQDINDLITLNLDVERFAKDVISQSDKPELLRAFWHAVRGVSILDPTCGSGAFLFAALNVLEPLYVACVEGMHGFVDDWERSGRSEIPSALNEFKDVLEDVSSHPSRRYFILKSIVLNNLYGVDIMEEAVEICKLRLLLKLFAQIDSYEQIEPLPDIDFNVRAGNTLIGFTAMDTVPKATAVATDYQHSQMFSGDQTVLNRIKEEAKIASGAFDRFRWQQIMFGEEITSTQKMTLRRRLRGLAEELNRYLAADYDLDVEDSCAYESWRASYRPFHWFVEFYGIMNDGGFNVVIGNPPYVPTKNLDYSLGHQLNAHYPDIYAHVLQKSMRITSKAGRCGMILPLSIAFSRDFSSLRKKIQDLGTLWLSSFDNIPAALFGGVSQRCTILLSAPDDRDIFTTRLYRWRAQFRASLMANVTYTRVPRSANVISHGFPRLSNSDGERLLRLHSEVARDESMILAGDGSRSGSLGFSPTARNFISTYLESPPTLAEDGTIYPRPRTASSLALPTPSLAVAALAATSGAACFWYWLTRGDGFHVTNALLSDYLKPLSRLGTECQNRLEALGKLLHRRRNSALVFKKNAGRYVGNYNYRNMSELTVRADLIFLVGLGATWSDAENLLSFAALVRAVNEATGERNIPENIRNQFVANELPRSCDEEQLVDIDEWLALAFEVPIGQVVEASRI